MAEAKEKEQDPYTKEQQKEFIEFCRLLYSYYLDLYGQYQKEGDTIEKQISERHFKIHHPFPKSSHINNFSLTPCTSKYRKTHLKIISEDEALHHHTTLSRDSLGSFVSAVGFRLKQLEDRTLDLSQVFLLLKGSFQTNGLEPKFNNVMGLICNDLPALQNNPIHKQQTHWQRNGMIGLGLVLVMLIVVDASINKSAVCKTIFNSNTGTGVPSGVFIAIGITSLLVLLAALKLYCSAPPQTPVESNSLNL